MCQFSKVHSVNDFPLITFHGSNDIWIKVFSFFKPIDLVITARVCQFFRKLSSDDILWKEFIKKDFPEQMASHVVSVKTDHEQPFHLKEIYKQLQLKKLDIKITALITWMSFLGFQNAETLEKVPTLSIKENYKNLCHYLYGHYFSLINHDYSQLGKVFRISKQPLDTTFPFDESFSLACIEQEHEEALFLLLNKAIDSDHKLIIKYENDPSPDPLQPFQKKLLQRVFDELSSPIEFVFCNARIKTEDLPFFCQLIEQGKVNRLNLDDNLIDAEGLDLLLKSAHTRGSCLTSLSLYANPEILSDSQPHQSFDFQPVVQQPKSSFQIKYSVDEE